MDELHRVSSGIIWEGKHVRQVHGQESDIKWNKLIQAKSDRDLMRSFWTRIERTWNCSTGSAWCRQWKRKMKAPVWPHAYAPLSSTFGSSFGKSLFQVNWFQPVKPNQMRLKYKTAFPDDPPGSFVVMGEVNLVDCPSRPDLPPMAMIFGWGLFLIIGMIHCTSSTMNFQNNGTKCAEYVKCLIVLALLALFGVSKYFTLVKLKLYLLHIPEVSINF